MFAKVFRTAALSLLVASPAFAQQVIDQQQTGANYWNYVNYGNGQSFTPTLNNSTGAGVLVSAQYGLPTTVNLITRLWGGGLPFNGGTLLASATTSMSFQGYETQWMDAFWSSSVALTPGTTYYLSFIQDADLNADKADFGSITADAYAGGNELWAFSNVDGAPMSNIAPFDLAFRTYGDAVQTAPEPASLTLFATGVVGLMVVRRRRRANAR